MKLFKDKNKICSLFAMCSKTVDTSQRQMQVAQYFATLCDVLYLLSSFDWRKKEISAVGYLFVCFLVCGKSFCWQHLNNQGCILRACRHFFAIRGAFLWVGCGAVVSCAVFQWQVDHCGSVGREVCEL